MSLAYRATADFAKLNHPMRVPLSAEIHSRPFLQLQAPESLTHFALYVQQDHPSQKLHRSTQHEILQQLCAHYGVAAPGAQARYFFHDFGRFRLKWECHTEFATFTFVERADTDPDFRQSFQKVPLQHVPQEWLAGLHGKIIVAAHVLLCAGVEGSDKTEAIAALFQGKSLVGSNVAGAAEVWTDFLIQPDGFSRFVVRDMGLREFQSGRLVGRLLEIETYRMMALLGLPNAEASQPLLNGIENELADLTATLVQADQPAQDARIDAREEGHLLHHITSLAARLEKISVNNSYRFAASQAYFSLVQARIHELREVRIAGIQTLAEFMGRRLAPAMHTCTSVALRQEALAKRIGRSNDLLRTRVGIEQEGQNRKILQSLDARAAQQLRLQQAVEGLSAVAISYYTLGLIGYAGKAMKAGGLAVNPDILQGVAVPVVIAAVWLGLRRVHHHIAERSQAGARQLA
ncbi:UNVERIFIED_ORG: putative membrane-anchored protein [Zoogloea ramigera]|uniref:DUF3422 domain-containing protein n=1 Tax=Duganella zoogloeoides TaxID=75659 RepID=A0ABZ0XVM1_9BURK|nr:DUF3422 domain-containing protein [Duganella zoogloeoides]WQH03439.1 DUF3422 domain-containing protein [Duganella zoogloeoides]